MDKSLFRYVWRFSKKEQLFILLIVLASMPFYFMSLSLPKTIVNKAIQGEGFDFPEATANILELSFDIPGFLTGVLGEKVTLFSGIDVERLPYLVALSLMFLALVCINGLFKFYINTFKGRLGERMLRRLRYTLVDRVMRLPPLHFRKVKAPEIATMVKDEVEPLGGFIGDAFIQPIFLGGQAATAMAFILLQSYWLGSIAAGIVLAQAFIIPRLRKRLLVLGKERQLAARALAGRVGEIVDGVVEVHVNDTTNYERSGVSDRLGRIFNIRYEIFRRKFFVKFLNNFLSQVTPFLFYLVGGYLAIRGNMDIGQLVAVIAAYKDLPAPIKELIDWDQQRLDVQIKYTQVVKQFDHEHMLDSALQPVVSEPILPLTGNIQASNLTLLDDSGAKLLENANFTFDISDHIGVVGTLNGGAEHSAESLVRLLSPNSGKLTVAGSDIMEIPESVLGRRIAYVGPDVYLGPTSIRENLLYGLRYAPFRDADYDDDQQSVRNTALSEIKVTGNSLLDINADWIDYDSAGVGGPEELEDKLIGVLSKVGLDEDIYRLGLRGTIDTASEPGLAAKILQVRHALRERLNEPPLSKLVEPFDPSKYNRQASIAENLLFGTSIGKEFAEQNLATNAYTNSIISKLDLEGPFFEMGRGIASTVVELFADLPPDHPFFDQVNFMEPDDLPLYEAALNRIKDVDINGANEEDRAMMMALPFSYVEPRLRLGLLDEDLQNKILEARVAFREGLPDELSSTIEFYEPDTYNTVASLQDNILLGRIAYGAAEGPAQIGKAIDETLDELDLRSAVFHVGLDYNVGTGGKRLNGNQRQKIGLARAILKRPDLVIINKSLAGLDKQSKESIITAVLENARDVGDGRKQGIYWVLAEATDAKKFERVMVFEDGSVAENGPPDELAENGGAFTKLISSS